MEGRVSYFSASGCFLKKVTGEDEAVVRDVWEAY